MQKDERKIKKRNKNKRKKEKRKKTQNEIGKRNHRAKVVFRVSYNRFRSLYGIAWTRVKHG